MPSVGAPVLLRATANDISLTAVFAEPASGDMIDDRSISEFEVSNPGSDGYHLPAGFMAADDDWILSRLTVGVFGCLGTDAQMFPVNSAQVASTY